MQPVVFHQNAHEAIQAFPRAVRDWLGKALFLLQIGEQPVLHAFVKKTRRTPPSEIEAARKRWKEMQDEG